MFSLNGSIRYYLYPRPTDMRKGFYTLSGIVSDRMGFDVCEGDAFIFINRSLDSMKILHMEAGGLVIYHMKLEAGRYCLPDIETEDGQTNHPTTWQELVLMVQGTSQSTSRRQTRWKPIRNTEKSDEKNIVKQQKKHD